MRDSKKCFIFVIRKETKTNSIMREDLILSDLVNNAKFYQLEGFGFTQGDVDYVEMLIAEGKSYDEAIDICLSDMSDVLDCEEDDEIWISFADEDEEF